MKNEPVAWIIKYDDSVCEFGNVSQSREELQEEIDECTKNVPHWNHGTIIPLYTYSGKTLTNEEISDIRDEFFAPDGCNIYTFARALLKKASEI
ncbi:MAG: hypothetical protein WCK82_14140 [Bacteroidota bacterium]